MDIKDLLSQYNSLIKEIRELEMEIDRLEKLECKHEKDKVKGSNPYFPYQARSFTVEGYNILEEERINNRIYDKKSILVERKNKCEEVKLQIEMFISDIPDSRTRRVFRYRYINNLSWQAIAMRIGKTHESYPRRDIHDKYLENL